MSMRGIFVLVEHRRGRVEDISFEMLSAAKGLSGEISAVLLGHEVYDLAEKLRGYAHNVLYIDDENLENFSSETYQRVLSWLIREKAPDLTLIGHTSFGMDLAPSLAAELDLPLVTDCVDLEFKHGKLTAVRQMYGGKVNANTSLKGDRYIATIRPATFQVGEPWLSGEIVEIGSPLEVPIEYKKFVKYVEAEVGEVDITSAEAIIAVGRGIEDAENIPLVKELADEIGGVLACSRPIVDKGWLPKDRQVGTSGKTVKPKLYIAIGISGSFQHVGGISADTIIAINKDPKAPIFNVADYGIVDDLFKIVPVLKDKIKELKEE